MIKKGLTFGLYVVTALALGISLTACSTANLAYSVASGAKGTQGTAAGEEALAKQTPKDVLHVGITKRADVEKIYGEPSKGFANKTDDGLMAVSYTYIKGKSNFATAIPILNLFKGEGTGEIRVLSLAYDQNNVLVWYRYKLSESNTKGIDHGCLKVLDLQSDGVEPDSIKKADEDVAAKQKSLPECSGTTADSTSNNPTIKE